MAPYNSTMQTNHNTHTERSSQKLDTTTFTADLPQLSKEAYGQLRSEIEERGILVPIELDEDGNVLDGAHRMRVCEELGVSAPTITRRGLSEEEKQAHALTLNLTRRHLSPEDRKQLHRKMRALGKSLRAIAEATGSSPSTVKRDTAGVSPDASERVIGKDGKTYLATRPAPVINYPEAITEAELVREQRKEAQPIAEPVPPPRGKFQVIYADPPWELGGSGSELAVENHYETQTLEEIKQLPVPAADDSVLFLWVVSSKLREGLETMEAWGYEYLTNITWAKNKQGLGRYVRTQHELLLIGKRGKIPVPEAADRPSSVIHAPRGAHSVKPDEAYEAIERMFPTLTKRIELYARRPRKGWRNWGKEAPDSLKELAKTKTAGKQASKKQAKAPAAKRSTCKTKSRRQERTQARRKADSRKAKNARRKAVRA